MSYQLRSTGRFDKDVGGLDKPIRLRIDRALTELSRGDPYKATKSLRGPLRCKRSLRVGKYRVILTICEECLSTTNCRAMNHCENQSHSRNDLLLQWVDLREEVYE